MDDEFGNTGGRANQTALIEALRSCIAEARTDLRPYFTRTVEIAKSCEGRGICLKDVFSAVIGDSKHRRQLEVLFSRRERERSRRFGTRDILGADRGGMRGPRSLGQSPSIQREHTSALIVHGMKIEAGASNGIIRSDEY